MRKSIKKKCCMILASLSAISIVNASEKKPELRRSNSAKNLRTRLTIGGVILGSTLTCGGYAWKNGIFPFNQAETPPPPQHALSTPYLTKAQMDFWENNLKRIGPVEKPYIGEAVFGKEDPDYDKFHVLVKEVTKEYIGQNFEDGYVDRMPMWLQVDSVPNSKGEYESLQDKFNDLTNRKPDFVKRGEMMLRFLKCTINNDDEVNALANIMRQNGYFDDKHTCITISPTEFPNQPKIPWFVLDGEMPDKLTNWPVRHQFFKFDEKGAIMKFDHGLFFCDGHGDYPDMDWRKTIYKIYSDRVEKLDFPKS